MMGLLRVLCTSKRRDIAVVSITASWGLLQVKQFGKGLCTKESVSPQVLVLDSEQPQATYLAELCTHSTEDQGHYSFFFPLAVPLPSMPRESEGRKRQRTPEEGGRGAVGGSLHNGALFGRRYCDVGSTNLP